MLELSTKNNLIFFPLFIIAAATFLVQPSVSGSQREKQYAIKSTSSNMEILREDISNPVR